MVIFYHREQGYITANNFGLDAKMEDGALTYIRESNISSLARTGIPALIAVRDKYCVFRTNFCFVWYKKSLQYLVNYLVHCFEADLCAKPCVNTYKNENNVN